MPAAKAWSNACLRRARHPRRPFGGELGSAECCRIGKIDLAVRMMRIQCGSHDSAFCRVARDGSMTPQMREPEEMVMAAKAAKGGFKQNDHDSVKAITALRFRHTLLFPLALARGETGSGFDTPAGTLVDGMAAALTRSDKETWREIDALTHCERAAAPASVGRSAETPDAHARPDDDLLAERYQETIFFHRFVQRFLYGDGARSEHRGASPAQRVFQRCGIARVSVALGSVEGFDGDERTEAQATWRASTPKAPPVSAMGRRSSRVITLAVDTINLHLFEAGIAVLAVTVSLPREAGKGVVPSVVRRTPANPSGGVPEQATVADLLDLIECFRRLYIPYWVEAAVGAPQSLDLLVWADGVPAEVTWHDKAGAGEPHIVPSRETVMNAFEAGFSHGVPRLLPWWEALLPKALLLRGTSQTESGVVPKSDLSQWRFVADERMATTTFLSVPNIARLSDGAWARLCFCDKAGDEHPYGHGFLENFDALHAYDRFSSWGTRYVLCGYNMACIVSEGDFVDLVEMHMRRHYFQMMLVAQFQAAALLAFSNWVSEAMEQYAKTADDTDDQARQDLRVNLHCIEREFQAFVHRYWFTGVSNQVQPSEIYAKLRELLSLDKWFAEVLNEIETSRGFLRDQEQERTARSAERLSLLAGLGLLVVVPAALLGMNFAFGDKEWLNAVLAMKSVQGALPTAKLCGSETMVSVSGQLAWTFAIVCLCGAALNFFPRLGPVPRSARRSIGNGVAMASLRQIARSVAVVCCVLALAFALNAPLCAPKTGSAEQATEAPHEPSR
ncbi:MAG: hypothetical protein HXX10_08390 [Rhodoplanes sp.]|uniref:hypothetical protein n=1 Tax=Rhodoplanes sp. TaxID=1968906 RepID=UPI00181D92B4|nr:hypothetical protein [Rhodoplanes sp.]NVO14040.1 hypothetical protein [Rhodoplanes sp.]